ncbi:MAG: phage holin family protein [Actinobacteria bacterium]|nr:phage holin family protein [Actinomycetota bacterium]
MIRLVATGVIALLANAVALVVGALVLDDMSLDVLGLVIAVLVYTGVAVLAEPLIRQMALKSAPVLLGSSSLVATLISLVITAIVSDGLRISGGTTWVLATVIVWAVALAARLLLPLVLFKKALAEARDRR